MIVILKSNALYENIQKIKEEVMAKGVSVHESMRDKVRILGLSGDTRNIDPEQIKINESVEKIEYIKEPYKKANRKIHPKDTIINVRDIFIGGNKLAIMAGPCSVESEEQIINLARDVKKSGATFLRGGVFKPRTSPYSFQGMGLEGLELLKRAREETGLPIVTEIMSPSLVDKFDQDVDIIQVGARNMQNFDLLKELGKTKKPILLKRGLASTIEELLMSAEYIMSGGNENIILCERGIRTYETYTRNTLDLSAIPVIKKYSHLPVIVDPSHAGGAWWLVEPLAKAAVAVGADGLMIEVHNDPKNAKSDGEQSLKPEKFHELMRQIAAIANVVGKEI